MDQKSLKYNSSYFDDINDDGTSPLVANMPSKKAPNPRPRALSQSFATESIPGAMGATKDMHSSFHPIEGAEKKKASMMESISDEDNASGKESSSQVEKDGDTSPPDNDGPILTDRSSHRFANNTSRNPNITSLPKPEIDSKSIPHSDTKATAPLSLNLTSDSTNGDKLMLNMNQFLPPDLRIFPHGTKLSQENDLSKTQALEEVSKPPVTHLDYADIGIDLISKIPEQRRNIVAKRGEVFTLMVAGESGLGKTTLINTLFGDKFEDSSHNGHQPLDGTQKTTRIEVREAFYVENGFPVKFTVIDTPGFGDFTNNTHCWVPIINYIDNQHKLYMLQEEQPDRRKKVDTRVHACLYFIRPSGKGLLPLDVKVMQELSTRVNLIPVLAKSDSFTLKDRDLFKQAVRNTITASGIEIYCPQDVNPDMDEDIRDIPYAIIASETVVGVDAKGNPIRARPYKWGIAEVENEKHCDFVKLRRVLMEKYMLDLIDSTIDKHYQRYRKSCMLRRIEHARAILAESGGPEAVKTLDTEGGLQTLVHISKYGKDFLEDGQIENDPIFRERQRKMNDRFAVVVAFHEDRFESWRNELRKKQDELNQDIEDTTKLLEELQTSISMLESQREREYENERMDREPRGFGKVGR